MAGCVDAIGFLKFDRLFVSFMSGDSTQFAVGASGADWRAARLTGGTVGLFVVGVTGGRLLAQAVAHAWRRAAVLGAETLLLLAGWAAAERSHLAVPCVVLAMGVQNGAVHRAGVSTVGLTYVTGTLVHFGERLADALRGEEPGKRWEWAPYLLMWIGLIAGAVVGAAAFRTLGLRALLVPALAAAVLCAAAGVGAATGPTDRTRPRA